MPECLIRETAASVEETYAPRRPIGRRIWVWYLSLATALHGLFYLLVPPYCHYDSAKFLLAASAIADGSFRMEDLLLENVVGYPALLAGIMRVAGFLGLDFMGLLAALQTLMGVGINAAVLIIASRLSPIPAVYLPAALLSVLSIEAKLFNTTPMTEVPYYFLVTWTLALLVTAPEKQGFRRLNAAILTGGSAGLIRPLGVFLPMLCWAAWCLRACFRGGQPRTALRHAGVSLLLALLVAGTVSRVSKDPQLSLRERLAILWITAVQQNDGLYEIFKGTEAFEPYRRDYLAWAESRQVPPGVSLEPSWTPTPEWRYYDFESGAVYETLRWWKVPPWVLTTQRHWTRKEALGWQADVTLGLIAEHPSAFLKQAVRNVQISLYQQQASDELALARARSGPAGMPSPLSVGFLDGIRAFHRWLSPPVTAAVAFRAREWLTLPMVWWTLSLAAGMAAGFAVYRRWEYACVLLTVLFHLVLNPTLSGYATRYRLPVEIFAGIFTMGWVGLLLRTFVAGVHPARREP